MPLTAAAQVRPYWQHTADPAPIACRAALVGLAWQWGNSLGSSKSPFSGVKAASKGEGNILKKLKNGQGHNEEAQKTYTECAGPR
jgi:hypothetical protein